MGTLPSLLLIGLSTFLPAPASSNHELTFQERVAAQRAIEQVYYAHQKDAVLPFEEAVPPDLIERKVRNTLRLSAALERSGRPITEAMMREEARRIASSTRMPDRLVELHAALGNDPVLILECLVRPVLADRLARSTFSSETDRQASPRQESWDEWWGEAATQFDDASVDTVVASTEPLPQPGLTSGCAFDDLWDRSGALAPRTGDRAAHSAVWTGNRMIVWGGDASGGAVNTGFLYDPVTDTTSPITTTGAPSPRSHHSAVWTGSRMIVWGGWSSAGIFGNGGSYDPVADTWSPVSTTSAPTNRIDHAAVWTGTLMIVWGGYNGSARLTTGGRYDPQTDQWSSVATTAAPTGSGPAVWTGSRMIVWGGKDSNNAAVGTGARYDPLADSWSAMRTSSAPSPRSGHTSVWDGARVIVWGGLSADGSTCLNTGSLYDPRRDRWDSMTTLGAPPGRCDHVALSADNAAMLVWGGRDASHSQLNSGGLFDAGSNTWSSLPTAGAPAGRSYSSAVWTGSLMVVWGGSPFAGELYGRYNPSTGSWLSSAYRPLNPRGSGVWTGTVMFIQGLVYNPPAPTRYELYDPALDRWSPASGLNAPTGTSGPGVGGMVWTGQHVITEARRYDLVADTWTAISTINAPPAGGAVWTGSEMLLWSGSAGGRYSPTTDSWSPMSATGAPGSGTLIWTGTRMLVWNGSGGGQYDPSTDTWGPVSVVNGPLPASGWQAVWAGGRMVVWGGSYLSCISPPQDPCPCCTLSDFWRQYRSGIKTYDPDTDTWTTHSGPAGLEQFTAVSTGTEAIFWGGIRCPVAGTSLCGDPGTVAMQTGFRFNPQAGTSTATSTVNAPSPRGAAIGVFTGHEMIVWGGYTYDGTFVALDGGRYGGGPSPGADADGDGFDTNCDCNDADPATWPGAPQVCGDAVSNDCSAPGWPSLTGTNEWDDDGDGFMECAGDCDDTLTSVRPGAPQICDGLQNDCNAAGWPAPPASEADQDGDGFRICSGDCDDTQANVSPGSPQICDGLNNDCGDPSWPAVSSSEMDQDGDGFRPCSGDCDEAHASVRPGGPQACDGLNNDCSAAGWPALTGTNEMDDDGDGFTECAGDCDDLASARHPGAPEINDGIDDQCPGDPGFGSIDEVGDLWFPDRDDATRICWSAQPGATFYRMAVAGTPFTGGPECGSVLSETCGQDAVSPPPGHAYYYLVHTESPYPGSWGQTSSGAERVVNCGGVPAREFSLVDDPGADDVPGDALFNFFNSMPPPAASDDILFEIESSPGVVESLCSQSPDFYRDNYLSPHRYLARFVP